MKQYCVQLIQELVGSDFLYFDTVLLVKKTPHSEPARIWGACVSPDDGIYLMDSDEAWHEVKDEDTLILQSLYQRLRFISQTVNQPKEVLCN